MARNRLGAAPRMLPSHIFRPSLAGLLAVLSLAGCSSGNSDGGDFGSTPPPTSTQTDAATPPVSLEGGAGDGASTPVADSGASVDAGASQPEAGVDAGSSLGNAIASLALANVGQGACTTNTLGGTSFGTSCTGNGGQPEYWCADFALWVWRSAGVTNLSGLDAAAGSFYTYGKNNNTLSNTPAVGDAVVFNYTGGGVANHVAIVTQVNADGTIESVSGDWEGQGSTEAAFSSTSSVVLNSPAYPATIGSTPNVMGQTISGFVAPVGLQ
jgi:hypothetical protein